MSKSAAVKPMWEDPANANGGKWVIYVKHDRVHFDKYWENLLYALIGGTLAGERFTTDEISGAVASKRRGADRISVWNRNCDDPEMIMELGNVIRAAMGDGLAPATVKLSMEYTQHEPN